MIAIWLVAAWFLLANPKPPALFEWPLSKGGKAHSRVAIKEQKSAPERNRRTEEILAAH
jgi:hypothetical protein